MRGPPGCSVLRAPGPVRQHRAHRRTSVILGPVVVPFSLHSGTLFRSLGGLLKYIPLLPSSFEERTHSRRRASVFRRHPLLPPLPSHRSPPSHPLCGLCWAAQAAGHHEGHLPGEPPSWARGHSDPPAGGCYSPVESPRPGLSKRQSRNPAVALQWRERLSAPPSASPGGWAGFIVHTLTSFKEWWAVPSLISPCASWCLTSFQCCRVVSFKVLSKIRRNYILP